MDFTFTDEQMMLRDGVTRLLERHYSFEARQETVRSQGGATGETWDAFAQMGLLALPVPESRGGLGGSPVDLVAITDLFGRHLSVEPYLGSILLAGKALLLGERVRSVETGWMLSCPARRQRR